MRVYVFIRQWMSEQRKCVCVYENLGCFFGLAIVSNTAINTGCMNVFKFGFLSFPDICPGVGLQDYMATPFLVF